MRTERLAEIKEAVEGLDTGKYHGADMVADALVEMTSNARELIEEIERIREKNPYLIGDRVKLEVDPESEENDEPTEGVCVAFGGPRAILVDAGTWKSLWYSYDNIERIED